MWVGWKKQDTSGKTLNISYKLNATSNATSSSKQL